MACFAHKSSCVAVNLQLFAPLDPRRPLRLPTRPLPPSAGSGERRQYVVDFKATVDPTKWWELAKDMAAFANALGGVILVGVKEGPPPVYEGLPRCG